MKAKAKKETRDRSSGRRGAGGGQTERALTRSIEYLQKAQEALTKLQESLADRESPARAARGAAQKSVTRVREESRSGSAKRQGRSRGSRTRHAQKPAKQGKWIESVDEHEDRPGQTLRTRNHDVIRRWAEERDAAPATVPGTEHGGRAGVLRFNFPDYGGKDLKEIEWDEWFEPFDERDLVFIYQEHKTNGSLSNFFRLDNPNREDA